MKLAESVYMVTGGGSGLGAATVRRFHKAGAYVVICNRDSAKGQALAGELGIRTLFVRTDVTNEADVAHAVEVAQNEFGALHGVVNCAGIALQENVFSNGVPHRLDTFTNCLQVNLAGTFNVIRLATAVMLRNKPNEAQERGVIVNTSSIVAYEGQAGTAAYAASNAGIIGMTLPIARELAHSGVRVMTIAPGPFLTPRLEGLSFDVRAMIAKAMPFPSRLGHPDEYAALAQHIVENEMLNGHTIRLDGAMRLPTTWT